MLSLINDNKCNDFLQSSSSEQLSRFLQDSSRTELRLTVTRPADRSKVVQGRKKNSEWNLERCPL